MRRFEGTVEPIGRVHYADLAHWLGTVPFEAWPQQKPLDDGLPRPAMVTDLGWRGFGQAAWPVVQALGYDETQAYQLMLSVVMPGHKIEPHCDQQPPDWLYRVHVPLASNYRAVFICGGVEHIMMPGIAYKVNTEAEHAVANRGEAARVHFMFDVRRA